MSPRTKYLVQFWVLPEAAVAVFLYVASMLDDPVSAREIVSIRGLMILVVGIAAAVGAGLLLGSLLWHLDLFGEQGRR